MPVRGRYSPFNLAAFNAKLDHGLLLGLDDDDHGAIYIPYSSLAANVYTIDTASITLSGGTLTANTLTDGTATITGGGYTSSGSGIFGGITIFNATPILVFKDSNSLGAASVGFIEWRDSGGGRAGFLGNHTSSNDDFLWKNEQGGNIGIQTTGAGTIELIGDTNVTGDITSTGTVTGGTLTDGTASITGGAGTGFTSLVVDNITIDVNQITSDTGFIDFLNDVPTTSTMFVIGNPVGDRTELNRGLLNHIDNTTFTIKHSNSNQDIDFIINDGGVVKTIMQFDTDIATVKIAEDLFVNSTNVVGKGLTLEGSGTAQSQLGGLICWQGGQSGIAGYSFANTARWCLSLNKQSGLTDSGIASIDFTTGAAEFAGGDFNIDGNGFIIDLGGIGDGTNYTAFAADGLQTMAGTARVTRSIDLEPVLATRPAANPPGEGTEDSFPTHDFSPTTDESVFFHLELPHDYAGAGLIHIHFDFFVDTAPASAESVVWGVEYKKQSIGDNFDFTAGTTIAYTQTSITTGTPANDKKVHESAEISLTTTGFVAGDFILLRLFRDADGTGGTDDFTGDARVLDYHIEYLSDKLGEAT